MLKENNKGFTLIETVLSILLFSIIAASLFTALNQMVFSFKKQEKMAEAQDNMRIVINWVTRDVKAAKDIVSPGNGKGEGNSLKIRLEDGKVYKYYYDNGVFYRKEDTIGAQPQPLTNTGYILNNPPYLDFSPAYNFFTPVVEDGELKLIELTIYGGYKEKNGEYATSVMTTKVYRREFKLGESG
ncbi:MAG TPA: hypothetical protein DHV84_01845 [Desulfotomaculum sp.]|nr:hypothetical protein [Desulfotomaculum sp.]